MNLETGLYEVISVVTIRREPRIVEYWEGKKLVTNAVGTLPVGAQRTIYSIVTEKDNSTWGRISFADGAGLSQWVCMKNVNREFVKRVGVTENEPTIGQRIEALESWARTQGYKG